MASRNGNSHAFDLNNALQKQSATDPIQLKSNTSVKATVGFLPCEIYIFFPCLKTDLQSWLIDSDENDLWVKFYKRMIYSMSRFQLRNKAVKFSCSLLITSVKLQKAKNKPNIISRITAYLCADLFFYSNETC